MSFYTLDFPKTFDEYFHALVLFAKRFGLDIEECESIVQDSFVALWENKREFSDNFAVRSYLYATVRGKALNNLRHKKVETEYAAGNFSGEKSEEDCVGAIIEEETQRLLFQAIHRLPEQIQEILFLNLEGKTNQEIADLLRLSIDTIKFHKKNAYKILRKELQKYFYLIFINFWVI